MQALPPVVDFNDPASSQHMQPLSISPLPSVDLSLTAFDILQTQSEAEPAAVLPQSSATGLFQTLPTSATALSSQTPIGYDPSRTALHPMAQSGPFEPFSTGPPPQAAGRPFLWNQGGNNPQDNQFSTGVGQYAVQQSADLIPPNPGESLIPTQNPGI